MAAKVIHMSLAEFEEGFDGPPTPDDVTVTNEGHRLDSKEAVLAWWAEVGPEVEAEEAAEPSGGGDHQS